MSKEKIEPRFRTPPEEYSSAEKAKLSTDGLKLAIRSRGHPANLGEQFRDTTFQALADVAETLAKSYGIYLEFNRAKTGRERDWVYMLRISIPGGGPLRRAQWAVLDDIANRYTSSTSYTGSPQPSLRITTRQNLQLHWVRKQDLVDVVQAVARSGFFTLNGCGDNVRNVTACPLSRGSPSFDAHRLAQEAGRFFRLPSAAYLEVFAIDPTYLRNAEEPEPAARFAYAPNLLNRKFKIGVATVHRDPSTGRLLRDNCVEVRTDDIGIVPVIERDEIAGFQVYVGGSQGERIGHSTFAALGEPLGILPRAQLIAGMDAIVRVHQEWGDRKNRHWSRLKYVLRVEGIDWFRARVREAADLPWAPADAATEPGARQLHHGWAGLDGSDRGAVGVFVENGRIIDGPNGRLKTMVRRILDESDVELFLTPNQDLLFSQIASEDRTRIDTALREHGYGARHGRPYSSLRMLSGACVGRDTCRLTYTDSEKFEPFLIDELEPRWGALTESIGVTGCERQCFRPGTKTIGWTGTGLDQYALRLGGTEDGRHQGGMLIDPRSGEPCLTRIPRRQVAAVTDALFQLYADRGNPDEQRPGGAGYFFRRIGAAGILEHLGTDPRFAALLPSPPIPTAVASTSPTEAPP